MSGFAAAATVAARLATGVLGWSPAMFWNATVAEFMTALEGRFGVEFSGAAAPLAADELSRLKERFPDG